LYARHALLCHRWRLHHRPDRGLAQQDKPKAESETTKEYRPVTPEQIEKHTAHLHDQLQITAPEEAAGKNFSQVMRDNSHRMDALIEKWSQEKSKLNAVENVKARHIPASTSSFPSGVEEQIELLTYQDVI